MNLASRFYRSATFSSRSYATTCRLERLTDRSLIRVHGEQSKDFLQSLITNDMNHLNSATTLYAMFLNKAGRVLYDAIVYRPDLTANTYLIECDRQIDVDLQKHLKMFRVRKKIDIDVMSPRERSVWVAFGRRPPPMSDDSSAASPPPPSTLLPRNTDNLFVANDPRVRQMGSRIITNGVDVNVADVIGEEILLEPADDGGSSSYTEWRYQLGIAEGIDELPVLKCFPLESNCDYLHGVSFHKGCYLGQEFTARTHHTGVVRKRLMPVRFETGASRLSAKSSRHVESTHGVVLGKTRGFHGDYGLALLKFEAALAETSPLIFGNPKDEDHIGVLGRVSRPEWWPQEAPSVEKLKEKI